MGEGAEIVAGIASGLGGLIQTGYNIYAGNRDFDYQKALQQEIFNREDNAVQRRMKDLEAVGLNPNLAAGSAAGAGAVVGRSNTPQISGNPVGTALDTAAAVMQLRAQRQQNEILKNQKDISSAQAEQAEWNKMLNNYQTFQMLGLKPSIHYNFETGEYDIRTSLNPEKTNALDLQLFYQMQNNKNSANLLQKDVQWYNAQQIEQMIGTAARAAAGFGNAYKGFNYSAPNYQTYHNSQNFYANPYIKNNW